MICGRQRGGGRTAGGTTTGDASFEMCTKIKIFLGKKKLIFAVLFPFLLSDDGSVSVNFEKSTVQHSLG